MLAEVLQSHGYATFGYSTTPMAAEAQGFGKGFDQFNETGSSAPGVTEFLQSVVSGSDPEIPRFVWAHYMEPHWPYGDYVSDRTSACWKLGARVASGELTWGGLQGNAGGLAQEALGDCKIMYDRDVAAVDREIGELLEVLETQDRKNGAIVVFTADHGESLGEEGLYYEHGPSLHDASVLVPLVIVAPQLTEGLVFDSPIQLEDLMPTILSLAGIPASGLPAMDGTDRGPRLAAGGEEDLDGITFLESASALKVGQPNFLRSGRAAGVSCLNWDRFSLCSSNRSEQYSLYDRDADPGLKTDVSADHPEVVARLQRAAERWPPEQARSRAVRSASFKLVERPVLDGGYERVLYDLRSDPEEQKDVSGAHPATFRRLGESLDGWVQSLPQGHQQVEERDEEALEQLRALGYVN
jgi:arylsulfatase A-like enzyme